MNAVVDIATVERTKRGARRLTGAKPTIGNDIDAMWALREEKRDLESKGKKIEEEIASIEERLMETMRVQGVEKATGTKGSVSITSSVVANVTDWDSFLSYIYKNKYGHLLQRRVSDPAWRELAKEGAKPLPGTEAFTKKRLNLRALSS